MKDSVNSLFQQRFQGHELPVDPGVWAGIKSQVSAPAPDGVNELFRDRFQGHELPVDPAVWSGVSAQLGHAVTAGSTINGSVLGWAVAGVVAIAIGTALWLGSDAPEPTMMVVVEQPAQVVEEVQNADPVEAPLPIAQAATPIVSIRSTPDQRIQVEPKEKDVETGIVPTDVPVDKLVDVVDPPKNEPLLLVVSADKNDAGTADAGEAADGAAIVESIIRNMTAEVQKPAPDPVKSANDTQRSELPAESAQAAVPDRVDPPLPKLFMPNTFTPNGDGVNDVYEIGGTRAYGQVIVHITSLKTGQTVFVTNTGEAWSGSGCEDGMYLVALEALSPDGRTATEGKVVWLNRNPMN